MSILSYKWEFFSGSSTGAGTILDSVGLRRCQQYTFHLINNGTSTCSFGIEAGVDSTTFFARMGSTIYSLSSQSQTIVQFSGPVEAVRPHHCADG
jgi:hypothetical protein